MLLSIVIPVYNSEKYVRHTLQSVFGQEFDRSQVEVIVVNDGTKDRSMDIVREFAECESRENPGTNIKILEQENQGLSAARNTGLDAATGKYVWFVDSDDWIEDGFLGKVLPLLQSSDTDVLLFRIREHRESDGKVVLERTLFSDTERDTDFLELLQKKIDFTPMQLYLVRREFMAEHGLKFVCGIVHEDMEFAPRMLSQAKTVKAVPWFHYNYLWRESGSLTSTPTNRKKRIESLLSIIDMLKDARGLASGERNRKALETARFWLYRKVFNFMDYGEFTAPENGFAARIGEMKALVRSHLAYRATSMMFIRRLAFLVSPGCLKKRNKVI